MPVGTEPYGETTYGEGGLYSVSGLPQLLVEIAFVPATTTPGDADWIDVAQDARETITINRGREKVFDNFEPGTCSLTLESVDRRYDPLNLGSVYAGTLLPNRWLRVSLRWGVVTYRRFTGFINAWDQQYEQADYGTVKITATDLFGRLAAQDVVQPYLVVGRGRVGRGLVAGPDSVVPERTGARIARVLGNAGITDHDLDAGYRTLPAGQGEGKLLEYIQKVNRSEDGRLFVSAAGVPTFRDCYASAVRPEMRDSAGSFGERGVADHFVADVNITPHVSQLYNHIIINLDGGGQVEVEDVDSIEQYGRRTYQRDVLISDPLSGTRIARHILTRHKDPVPRLSKVVIEPDADADDLYHAVLARELGDRITVVGTPQGTGTPISQEAHIEQIADEIDTRRTLVRTTWALSAADTTNYLIVGQGRVGIDRVAA